MADYLIGFAIAFVMALTGVGAGVMTAPLLILFLKIPLEVAVSTALAYSAIVKLIVVPFQVARRQVSWKALAWMLAGGVPGVVAGSLLFRQVAAHGPKELLSFVLGAILLFTAGWQLLRYFHPPGIARPSRDRSKWLGAAMFPIGAEVGFSSSGAGALGTVALLGMTDLPAAKVVGTDLAFGLAIALVGSGVHLSGAGSAGYAGPLLLRLAVGGVVGGAAGAGVAPRVPNRELKLALSVWLVVVGLGFCIKAVAR